MSSTPTALRHHVLTEFLPFCHECGKVGIYHQLPNHSRPWIYEITTHAFPWFIHNPSDSSTYLIPFSIHHIKDRADGGSDNRKNIMLLCRSCHARFTGRRGAILKKKKLADKNNKATEAR